MKTKKPKITMHLSPSTKLEECTYVSLVTKPNGTHCDVLLKLQGKSDLTWQQAMDWAIEVGGELPSRPIAALLHANVKDKLQPEWYWCSDEDGTPYRWQIFMGDGAIRSTIDDNATGTAISVRCIPMTGV